MAGWVLVKQVMTWLELLYGVGLLYGVIEI